VTTIAVPALPTAPTNLAARASGANVVLTWRNSTTNQTNVIIERTPANGTLSFVEIGRVAGTVTTFTDAPPVPLASYVYRVRAINIAGSSPVSNQVTFIAPFPAPTGLTGTPNTPRATSKFVKLTWTNNAPAATGFIVERSTNGTAWTRVAGTPTLMAGSTTSYTITDSGMATGTYQYRVRAITATAVSTNATVTVRVQ
jgi:hypothetical protein